MSEARLQQAGTLSVVIAATLWGSTGVSAQYLLETTHSSPVTVTMLRMSLAGSLLLLYGGLRERRMLLKIFTSLRDVLSLLIFTLAGAMAVQLAFLVTVAASDAATATVLQFTSPVIVMVASCLLTRQMPGWRMVMAVCLAIVGAFLLVTHGSLTSLRISRTALTWRLISSVAARFMSPGRYCLSAAMVPFRWWAGACLSGECCSSSCRRKPGAPAPGDCRPSCPPGI